MRALRRHHRKRLQKARAGYWGMKRWAGIFGPPEPRQMGMVVDTPTPCSCWMCGNPRRYGSGRSLTMQEQRAAADEQAQWSDMRAGD
jgi:hypothetical protein